MKNLRVMVAACALAAVSLSATAALAGPPAGYTKPAAPAGVDPTKWTCNADVEPGHQVCWVIGQEALKLRFTPAGMPEWGQAQAPLSVDDKIRVAEFNGRYRGNLTHEPTYEAEVKTTVDGGTYVAEYQRQPSTSERIIDGLLIPGGRALAQGLAVRVAIGDHDGYYGGYGYYGNQSMGRPSDRGSCGGCQRDR